MVLLLESQASNMPSLKENPSMLDQQLEVNARIDMTCLLHKREKGAI